MIKINLPNPLEMSIPSFFAQMRIALKAAEKSYEEMKKAVDPEKVEDMFVAFHHPSELEQEIDKKGVDWYGNEKAMELYIEINEG